MFQATYSTATFIVPLDVSGYNTVQLYSSYLQMFQPTIQFSNILRIFRRFRLHYSSVHSSYLQMFQTTLQFSNILRIFMCFRLHYSSITFFVSSDVSGHTTVQLHSSYLQQARKQIINTRNDKNNKQRNEKEVAK